MEKRQVNPWAWQDARGFSQAWRVDGAQTVVFLAGQVPLSADGQIVGRTPQPASTALQVSALAAPEIMIQVEAIADL